MMKIAIICDWLVTCADKQSIFWYFDGYESQVAA